MLPIRIHLLLATCRFLSAPACPITCPSYAHLCSSTWLCAQLISALSMLAVLGLLTPSIETQSKISKTVSSSLHSCWFPLISRRLPESRPPNAHLVWWCVKCRFILFISGPNFSCIMMDVLWRVAVQSRVSSNKLFHGFITKWNVLFAEGYRLGDFVLKHQIPPWLLDCGGVLLSYQEGF